MTKFVKNDGFIGTDTWIKSCSICGRRWEFANERLCLKLLKLHYQKAHNSKWTGSDVVRLHEYSWKGREMCKKTSRFGD